MRLILESVTPPTWAALTENYAEGAGPRAAKFWWSGPDRRWRTDVPERAAQLRAYGDEAAQAAIDKALGARQEAREASKRAAPVGTVQIPVPEGLALLPYQAAGVEFCLRPGAPRGATLIADEMGLGKTIQALATINSLTLRGEACARVLAVVPASLKINWQREAEKWLLPARKILILNGGKPVASLPEGPLFAIVNYDILGKHRDLLMGEAWDVLVLDESHYLKSRGAQRTKAVYGSVKEGLQGLWDRAARKLLLTGTPLLNRPVELWTMLEASGLWKSYGSFTRTHCAAHHNGFGWDVNGASNLPKLNQDLRERLMVRRLKADVLKELPAKRRAVVCLGLDPGSKRALKEEASFLGAHTRAVEEAEEDMARALLLEDKEAYSAAVSRLRSAGKVLFEEMSAVRHAVAVSQIPALLDWARTWLEGGEGKLVVFAHHLDVLHALHEGLGEYGSVLLCGETSMEARQAAVDRFQQDASCRVFVGGIRAAGVGITLTAAATVAFGELDWSPALVQQAEDRLHRIGQVHPVQVHHLVLDGSLDSRVARLLVGKQDVCDRTLDGPGLPPPEEIVVPPTRDTSGAPTMSQEACRAVHEAIRALAGVCDGAWLKDGQGFNGLDAKWGHQLAAQPCITPRQAAAARRMLVKYHKQVLAYLGEEAWEAIYGKKEEES